MSYHDKIQEFCQAIDSSKLRVKRFPSQILVFGGEQGVKFDLYISSRNVLLATAHKIKHPLATDLVTPEEFPAWNNKQGYNNLVEFEIDAGCLSRAILLIVETEGAYAELGAFCMDPTLRERLLCVINRQFYESKDSFIFLGPLTLIQEHNDYALCSVDDVRNPKSFEPEVTEVLSTLQEKINNESKTISFDPSRRRDQLLYLIDVIDLFRALTFQDIVMLIAAAGISMDKQLLTKTLWLLELFGFIGETQIYGKRYYVSIKNKDNNYIDIAFKDKTFDRTSYKLALHEELKDEQHRHKAFREYGEVAK